MHLRESAQRLGLLRKRKGELLLTSRGLALADDPVALWWYLAERMPIPSTDPFASQAGLLFLVAIAGGPDEDVLEVAADILSSIGWMLPDGTAPTPWEARAAARDTYDVLRRLRAIASEEFPLSPDTPTMEGGLFARAALTTWPK